MQLRTRRLVIRAWRADDAALLAPVLEANVGRLIAWIPRRVAEPAALPDLAQRLAEFAAAFDDDREWRYGLFTPDEGMLLGEVDLFPRAAVGRVPLAAADRVEIGYWLREEATGQGLATEAAAAMLETARTLPGIRSVEIRCDARNDRSAAVPRRLGFHLAATVEEPTDAPGEPPLLDQVWAYDLP